MTIRHVSAIMGIIAGLVSALLLLVQAAGAQGTSAQVAKPIRVDVSLVNVGFTVRDVRGVLVPNLTADDFEVLEDGVAQKIAFFGRSGEVPLTLGLVMDVSGSQEHFMKPHHRDLETFLKEVMSPRDRAFMVAFGNHIRLVCDYTDTPSDLLEGLRSFEKGNRRYPEFAPEDERELGTAFYDSIYYSVKERLAASSSGRRALLMFSDGEDNSSAWDMMDAIEAAQSEDVRLYTLRYTQNRPDRLNSRNKYGIRVMDRIAFETGGTHYDAREGELRNWFRQIADELRATYELAYHSTNPVRDGSFRKLVIRPKSEGLIVRAKTGYRARP
jgi:Ca-activated chloride channel homolog